MFHTHPDAEQPIPPGFMAPGEKCWRWVELSLQIPYLIPSFNIETEGGVIALQYMCTNVRDVISLIDTSGDRLSNLKVGLLSPGHMNGSNSFQFGQIKRIWQSKDGGELFLLDNGSKLYFSRSRIEVDKFDGELILAV